MYMLRSTRVLLLLAIVLILGAVGASWYRQRSALSRQAPKPPKSLPLDTAAEMSDWVYTKEQGGRITEVRARNFRQLNEPSRLELEKVEIRLFKPGGKSFDQIRSAHAQLDQATETLYSDGEVEITMGVPAEGAPKGRLMTIRSSGVSFDVKTGRATTEREASFAFDLGEGKAVGAVYDPNVRELIMKSQVGLHWRGADPKAKPMALEAGELTYRERDSLVLLPAWSRLTRDVTELSATDSVVTLEEGMIRKVEGKQARGSAAYPNRKLEYAADHLLMHLDAKGEVEKVVGSDNARAVSTSDAARTSTTADRVELEFDTAKGESTLKRALAMGHAFMESVPVPRKGVLPPESRRLRSEAILVEMRQGGREVAKVETHAPGHLEFLPNRPGQRHRTLDAERLSMEYGPENQVESFSAFKAATRTDPLPRQPGDKRPPDAPMLTWSDDLRAAFEPKTGQLSRLEQWTNFRYEQGDRQAIAQRAVLEQQRDSITLERNARIWDTSGSTAADRIALDQKSGDVTAEGNVVSIRLPEKKGNSSAVLSQEEPLNARAARMTTSEGNKKIHYEGDAIAWQGANRIWADSLDIDRVARRLTAHGNVRTQFLDQAGTPKAGPAAVFVRITASGLVYEEAGRVAHYTGGARLTRPGMNVNASEIRAWFNDGKSDSSLDRAFADGAVEVVRTEPGRTLTGTSEHAEYYAAEQKIILTKGDPTLVDSAHGYTKGRELTYWANNDKLLVNGVEKDPVRTLIRRRSSRE
jgi:lipopolysaccharide export system protein LptA